MKTALFALALALSQAASAPDVSGRWNQESGGKGLWGPRIEISQTAGSVVVSSGQGAPVQYRLDGKETAEVLSVRGCANKSRITKAVVNRDRITISSWLVTKSACVHRED